MLKGEKIYLRAIINEDLKYLNNWKNDENTYQFLGGGFMPLSIDQQKKWLESLIDLTGNNKRFIICNEHDLPIGMIGLYDIKWIHKTCEVGMFIGDKAAQGNGYSKEAYYLIEKFALEYLNIRKIKLNVVLKNNFAFNMWKKLGYKKVGELVEERFIKGEYHNLVIMEKFL